jgi:hypothetical protein
MLALPRDTRIRREDGQKLQNAKSKAENVVHPQFEARGEDGQS